MTDSKNQQGGLLPCPFCGVYPMKYQGVSFGYMIACAAEECAASPQCSADTKEKVIEAWNTRSVPVATRTEPSGNSGELSISPVPVASKDDQRQATEMQQAQGILDRYTEQVAANTARYQDSLALEFCRATGTPIGEVEMVTEILSNGARTYFRKRSPVPSEKTISELYDTNQLPEQLIARARAEGEAAGMERAAKLAIERGPQCGNCKNPAGCTEDYCIGWSESLLAFAQTLRAASPSPADKE